MNIQFPAGSGIKGFVYWLVSQIMGWGWISYGFAIVFFTLFIKLMMSPLDFLNRLMTRRTQMKQQALAGELADLEKIYANDPMGFARARQVLYQKNGVGGLGSSLISLVTLILTMVIFFNVMGALSNISSHNIKLQYQELQEIYQSYMYDEAGTKVDLESMTEAERTALEGELSAALNEKYTATKVSFGWIKNIWQPDSPFASSVQSAQSYGVDTKDEAAMAEYDAIFAYINTKKQVNGYFILAVISAVTVFLSLKINTMMAKKTMPQKTAAKKTEPIITYSLRDAKAQGQTPEQPTLDPAQMSKMMMWIMPVLYVFFATMQTSAFAIYMIASSLVSTVLSVGFAFLVDFIVKRMKKPEVTKEFDAQVINPHAKYFKGGKK